MLCYKDKTFCSSEDCTTICTAKLTEQDKRRAEEIRLPIMFSDFSGSCPDFKTTENEDILDYFKYNNIQIPDCSFKISPSSIGKFFKYPSVWYTENILNKKEFVASTSTVLGTIMHAAAASYCDGSPITKEDVEKYIIKASRSQPVTSAPINLEDIRKYYSDMAMCLVNNYVRKSKPTEWEKPLYAKVLDDIYIGGTTDNRTGDMVVDYKSYNSTTKPTSIPFDYKIQCLAYAYMFKQNGIEISRIRLVYVNRPIDTRAISEKTGKPIGKLVPSEVTVLTEIITPEDWEMINNTLLLIAESVQAVRSHPELAHIIFKSYKLKDI